MKKTTAILFGADDALDIMKDIMMNGATAHEAMLACIGEKLATAEDDDTI